jgi:large subunit ribosomal protein L17
MRHRKKTVKLGRRADHRDALLANLACSLIEHNRIKTTVAKAKALRPYVEKLVTKARVNTVHSRRLVAGKLGPNSLRVEKVVTKLFGDIAPANASRPGGYTRIIKLGPRTSDAAPMALIEFVEQAAVTDGAALPEAKPAKKATKPKAEAAAAEGAATEEKKPARKPRAKKTEEEKAAE